MVVKTCWIAFIMSVEVVILLVIVVVPHIIVNLKNVESAAQ